MRTHRLTLLLAATLAAAACAAPAATAAVKPLPKNFLWGVSSSAFQSEGHTANS